MLHKMEVPAHALKPLAQCLSQAPNAAGARELFPLLTQRHQCACEAAAGAAVGRRRKAFLALVIFCSQAQERKPRKIIPVIVVSAGTAGERDFTAFYPASSHQPPQHLKVLLWFLAPSV